MLDSHGVGDDLTVAKAMEQLPQDVDIVNLSLGGYTDDDAAPLAIASALNAMRKQRSVVVAAAGNAGSSRPFWPAAFKQVLAVGAVDEKDTSWQKARLQQLRLVGRRGRPRREPAVDVHQAARPRSPGPKPDPADPSIAFDGWAAWDGTSFATPIAAGDARPHDVAQRLRHAPPTRRPTCSRPHRRRRSRTSRSPSWWTSCSPRSPLKHSDTPPAAHPQRLHHVEAHRPCFDELP